MSLVKNIVEDCIREADKQLSNKCKRGSRQLSRKVLTEPATLDEILSGVVSQVGCELPDGGRFECENEVFKDIHDNHLIKVRYKVLTVEGHYSTFYETEVYLSDDELRLFGSEGFDYFDCVADLRSYNYKYVLTKEGRSVLESIFTKLVRVYSNILSYIENESLESGRVLLVREPVQVHYGSLPPVLQPTSKLILARLVRSSCEGLVLAEMEGEALFDASWECLVGVEG